MIRCIDISENKRINQPSPMAMLAFAGIFIVLTALMRPGVFYLICVILSYVLCQIFFYYKPRFVFLTTRFLFTNSYLTPSFDDPQYLYNSRLVPEIKKNLRNEL